MTSIRTVVAMARADFLERTRRASFLVTLAGAAALAYTVHVDVWTVLVAGRAPAPGPAATGILVALVTSTFLSLAAFYVVRGTVERDLRTGVGPILAAAPAGRLAYAAGKFASNAAVLGAMVLLLAALAVGIEAARAGGIGPIGAWRVIAPSLLITGPALAAVAGVAVVFDSVPWLRGTAGNVAYFFLWTGLLTFAGFDTGGAWLDVTGVSLAFEALSDALRTAVPGASAEGLTITANPEMGEDAALFAWSGVPWTPAHLARRLWWVGVGGVLSGVAAASLRLFDPFGDRGGLPEAGRDGNGAVDAGDEAGPGDSADGPDAAGASTKGPGRSAVGVAAAADLAAPGPSGPLVGFARGVAGELRLLLHGRPWWWYAGLAGANVAGLLVGPDAVAIPLLAAWVLPLPAWSELGCRERLQGTESLLFSGPSPRLRQLPAQLAAGLGVSLFAGAVPLGRLAAGGGSALAAAVGALFVPALALCLGAWTGKEKTFQAFYLVLWYVGPVNEVAALDFMGVTGRAPEAGATPAFAAATVVLAALAWLARGRRMRAVG